MARRRGTSSRPRARGSTRGQARSSSTRSRGQARSSSTRRTRSNSARSTSARRASASTRLNAGTRRRTNSTRTRRSTRALTRGRSRARSRQISTREYGLSIAPKSQPRRWNYAYSRGAGADRGKRPSYPIVPKARARAARTYAARRNTAGSLRTIDQAIRARYGSVSAIYSSGSRRRSRR